MPTDDCLRQALSILEEMRHLSGEKKELEKSAQAEEQQLGGLMLRLAERSHQFHALLPPEDPTTPTTARVKAPMGLEQIEPLWTEAQVSFPAVLKVSASDLAFSPTLIVIAIVSDR